MGQSGLMPVTGLPLTITLHSPVLSEPIWPGSLLENWPGYALDQLSGFRDRGGYCPNPDSIRHSQGWDKGKCRGSWQLGGWEAFLEEEVPSELSHEQQARFY